jgi:hypothetical protein
MILPRRFTPGGLPPVTPAVCDLPLSRFSTLTKTRSFGAGLLYSCIDWSDDGLHMYMGILSGNQIRNFKSSTTSWDLDSLGFVGLFRTGFDDVHGVRVKPDGSEVWANASTGLQNGHTRSYSLPTNYEWTETGGSAPSFINDFDNARAEFKHLEDLNIKSDGTKMISPGNDANSFPYQLNMTAWDGSTLAYGTDNKIIDSTNCFIPKSGECLYKSAGQVINKYSFGTSWDLTTLGASIVDTLDLTSDISGNIVAIFITEDRLFVVDDGAPSYTVYQYDA